MIRLVIKMKRPEVSKLKFIGFQIVFACFCMIVLGILNSNPSDESVLLNFYAIFFAVLDLIIIANIKIKSEFEIED